MKQFLALCEHPQQYGIYINPATETRPQPIESTQNPNNLYTCNSF